MNTGAILMTTTQANQTWNSSDYAVKSLKTKLGDAYNSFLQSQQLSRLESAYSIWRTTGDRGSYIRMTDAIWDITHPKHPTTDIDLAIHAIGYITKVSSVLLKNGSQVTYEDCERLLAPIVGNDLWKYITNDPRDRYILAGLCIMMAKLKPDSTVLTKTSTLALLITRWTGREVVNNQVVWYDVAELLFGKVWAALYEDELSNTSNAIDLLEQTQPIFSYQPMPELGGTLDFHELPLDLLY